MTLNGRRSLSLTEWHYAALKSQWLMAKSPKKKASPKEKALPKRKRYKELLLHMAFNILYSKVLLKVVFFDISSIFAPILS